MHPIHTERPSSTFHTASTWRKFGQHTENTKHLQSLSLLLPLFLLFICRHAFIFILLLPSVANPTRINSRKHTTHHIIAHYAIDLSCQTNAPLDGLFPSFFIHWFDCYQPPPLLCPLLCPFFELQKSRFLKKSNVTLFWTSQQWHPDCKLCNQPAWLLPLVFRSALDDSTINPSLPSYFIFKLILSLPNSCQLVLKHTFYNLVFSGRKNHHFPFKEMDFKEAYIRTIKARWTWVLT